jgi:hypothetical protein
MIFVHSDNFFKKIKGGIYCERAGLTVEDPVAKSTCGLRILCRGVMAYGSQSAMAYWSVGVLEYWISDLEAVPLIEIWHIVA